ncbi:MAG: hypothetical protein ABI995_16085 [Acidobacteriota bacterium]
MSVASVDANGFVYVAGSTGATDFPVTDGAYRTSAGPGFVAKLSADGRRLVSATYVDAGPFAVVVPGSGDVYVAGAADASFVASNGAVQAAPQGGSDAFVVRMDSGLRHEDFLESIGRQVR